MFFAPGGTPGTESFGTGVKGVEKGGEGVVPGAEVVNDVSAEADLESPKAVHGVLGALAGGDAEKVVFPGSFGSGVGDGAPLEEVVGHEFALEGAGCAVEVEAAPSAAGGDDAGQGSALVFGHVEVQADGGGAPGGGAAVFDAGGVFEEAAVVGFGVQGDAVAPGGFGVETVPLAEVFGGLRGGKAADADAFSFGEADVVAGFFVHSGQKGFGRGGEVEDDAVGGLDSDWGGAEGAPGSSVGGGRRRWFDEIEADHEAGGGKFVLKGGGQGGEELGDGPGWKTGGKGGSVGDVGDARAAGERAFEEEESALGGGGGGRLVLGGRPFGGVAEGKQGMEAGALPCESGGAPAGFTLEAAPESGLKQIVPMVQFAEFKASEGWG